jgi:hypothetical protein
LAVKTLLFGLRPDSAIIRRMKKAFFSLFVLLLFLLASGVSAAEGERIWNLIWQFELTEPRIAGELIHAARKAGLAPDDLYPYSSSYAEHTLPLLVAELLPYLPDKTLRVSETLRVLEDASNVERAYQQMVKSGDLDAITLLILSPASSGLEGRIYAHLRLRKFRATTGPDEGIDTRSLACYPGCIFVPVEEVNALGVGGWMEVLQHEARHVEQLINNPDLARDFVDEHGGRSLYAGFCEACADDGIYTTPLYYARERMARLRDLLGAGREPLIQRACKGEKVAYQQVNTLYDQLIGKPGAFAELFRPAY